MFFQVKKKTGKKASGWLIIMLITTVYDRLFVHFEELKVIVCYITKMLHKKMNREIEKGYY